MVAVVSEQPENLNEPKAVKGAFVDAENADVQNKDAEPVPAPTAHTPRHSPPLMVCLSRGGTAPPSARRLRRLHAQAVQPKNPLPALPIAMSPL